MQLPHPLARLANCCWLPRHIAKTRVYLQGELPLAYRLSLGSSLGIDGYFFRHFGLDFKQVLTAIRARPDEAAMAEWFLQQPGVTTQRIVAWNQFAPHLDRKGHPGYLARRIFTPLLNPASLFRPRVDTTFSAIAQDEGLPP